MAARPCRRLVSELRTPRRAGWRWAERAPVPRADGDLVASAVVIVQRRCAHVYRGVRCSNRHRRAYTVALGAVGISLAPMRRLHQPSQSVACEAPRAGCPYRRLANNSLGQSRTETPGGARNPIARSEGAHTPGTTFTAVIVRRTRVSLPVSGDPLDTRRPGRSP